MAGEVSRWIGASVRANGPGAIILMRLIAGGVFLAEGVKKFMFPAQWGEGRFAHIGIPWPDIMGPFVGGTEIVCAALLILGLLTRLASTPLLIDICVAIATTRIPILLKSRRWSIDALPGYNRSRNQSG
jgi:putative oxidoreductase